MHGQKNLKNVEDNNVTNILLMNKENCALKLVYEIILYYDARSKKHQITKFKFPRLGGISKRFPYLVETF